MKKIKRYAFLILFIIAVACAAACFSACKHTEDGTVNEPLSHTKGEWDRQNGVYIGMVSENDSPAGDIDENKVTPSIEMIAGEEYYFIIDFTLQAAENNDGRGIADVSVKISPAAAVDATLQETSSGSYKEIVSDDVKEIKIQFSIPDKAEEKRDKRVIVRLKPTVLSEYLIDISFEADKQISGNLTKEAIKRTVTANYTQGLEYTETPDGGYSVKAVNAKNATAIDIPYFKDGKYVTAIGDEAFKDCVKIKKLIMPDSVTAIGNNAFYNCSALTELLVPEGLTSIGESAFAGCGNLVYNEYNNAYYLGNENNRYVVLVKVKNTRITSCNINPKTRLIFRNAFSSCSELESLTISGGIRNIGESAFSGCSKLASVTISEGIASIGDGAFKYCGSLTEITIPDSVSFIGNSAFESCQKLNKLNLGNGVTSIGDGAFYSCAGLKEVVFPDGLTLVGDGAFEKCGLVGVTLGKGVKSIGDYAFRDCADLESATISGNVTVIGDCAFANCGKLKTVIWNAAACAAAGSYNNYVFAGCELLTEAVFGENVTLIPDNAFYERKNLVSVVIPDSVQTIGGSAFYGCGIKELIIGNGVKHIGSMAFCNCVSLTEVILPDGLQSIEERTFGGCGGLISAVIGSGVTSIGESAFYNCGSLTSIIIPDSVQSIAYNAFRNCGELSTLVIGGGITVIGDIAFYGCDNINAVFYAGVEEAWKKVKIEFLNTALTDAELYFYSETKPLADGNFWHYVDGEPAIWGA